MCEMCDTTVSNGDIVDRQSSNALQLYESASQCKTGYNIEHVFTSFLFYCAIVKIDLLG